MRRSGGGRKDDDALSVALVVDDSSYGRNTDFVPSRFESGRAAAVLLAFAVLRRGGGETAVSVSALGVCSRRPLPWEETFSECKTHLMSGLRLCDAAPPDWEAAVGVARLTMARRPGRHRLVLLLGSPLGDAAGFERALAECRDADVAVDVVSFGEVSVNRPVVAPLARRLGVALWEVSQGQLMVGVALLTTPLVTSLLGPSENPFAVWQAAFGQGPPAAAEEKSDLAERNAANCVPEARLIKSGIPVSDGPGILELDLVGPNKARRTVRLDARELFGDLEDVAEVGRVSLLCRNGRLQLLHRSYSVACGRCALRGFGGLQDGRRLAVVPEAQRGTLALCESSSGDKHLVWSSGGDEMAVSDDIVLSADFRARVLPDGEARHRTLLVHNKLATESVEVFFNHRLRRVPPGGFKAAYYLQAPHVELGEVVDRINAFVAAPSRMRPLLVRLDDLVSRHLPELLGEDVAKDEHSDDA